MQNNSNNSSSKRRESILSLGSESHNNHFDDDDDDDDNFSSSSQESRFLRGLMNMKSVGHKREAKIMKRAYGRVVTGRMSECLFVHGESGVGKTHSLDILRKNVRSKKHHGKTRGFFVSGKFDQLQTTAKPFSAIVEAFSELSDLIERSSDKAYKRQVRSNLRRVLSEDEALMLKQLVPNLDGVIGHSNENETMVQSTGSPQPAFVKLKLLCRNFLSTVATERHPIVFVLDDLQWGDEGSMEIFVSICSNMDSEHCLIVGVYRDDEGYEPPNIETLLPCTDLTISRLGLKEINHLVASLMDMKATETRSLAEVVYAKTRGNAQFVKLFLESLYIEQLLTFSPTTLTWEWDVESLMAETNDASNVLIAAKIDRLSFDVQEVLKLASCLGFSFDLDTLQLIVVGEYQNLTGKDRLPGWTTNHQRKDDKNGKKKKKNNNDDGKEQATPAISECFTSAAYTDILLELLSKAQKHGILVSGRQPYSFTFSHDQIFACIYSALPTGMERKQLHVRIGNRLLNAYPNNQYIQFVAVDQMNQGAESISSETQRLELVRLNLDTMKLASKKSAFDRAQDYAASALMLFPNDTLWQVDYDLALDLHTTAVEAVAVNQSPGQLVDKVVLHARTLEDQIPASTTLMNYFGWNHQFEETLDAGIALLKLLGERIPRNAGKLTVAWELTRANKDVKNLTDEQLLNLPVARDKRKIAAMKTLYLMYSSAFCTNAELMLVIVLRAFRISLRHGIDVDVTPFTFATFGVCQVYVKNEAESIRFHNLALKLLDIHDAQCIRSATYYTSYALGLHKVTPMEELEAPLLEGLRVGLQVGCPGPAMTCALNLLGVLWMKGTPLMELEPMADQYIKLMEEYNRNTVTVIACIYHQKVLNLMGRSKDPLTLTGTASDQVQHYNDMVASRNDVGLFMHLHYLMELHLMFGDWDTAMLYQKQILKHPNGLKSMGPHLEMVYHHFLTALLNFALYQRTGSRKQKRQALQVLKEMKVSKSKGCPNYDSYIPILVAEMKAKKLTKHELNETYRIAAAKCKQARLRAIAHERAACVIQEQFGDNVLQKQHLEAAKRRYQEWGATAKVHDVEEKLRQL